MVSASIEQCSSDEDAYTAAGDITAYSRAAATLKYAREFRNGNRPAPFRSGFVCKCADAGAAGFESSGRWLRLAVVGGKSATTVSYPNLRPLFA
jgi:hypothetical protein